MHDDFYLTCPSITCTHNTWDVTHTLGEVRANILCPNSTPNWRSLYPIWARAEKHIWKKEGREILGLPADHLPNGKASQQANYIVKKRRRRSHSSQVPTFVPSPSLRPHHRWCCCNYRPFTRRMQWRYRDLQLHSAITRRWLILYLNCNTWTSINPGSIFFLF
jgi:hypothetical protein